MANDANARTVYADLLALGLTPGAATGVVGNLIAESSVDPRAVQPGGPGRGIAQWSAGARWDQLLSWARSHNADPYALGTQEAFMVKEMKTSGVWDQLVKTTDPLTAAALVMRKFEMPADQTDANAARRAQLGIKALGQAAPAGSGSGSSPGGPTWQDWLKDPLGSASNDVVSKAKPLVFESLFVIAGLGLLGLGLAKTFQLRQRAQAAGQQLGKAALVAA